MACYKSWPGCCTLLVLQGYADYYLTRPCSSSSSQSPPGPPPPPPPSKSPSPPLPPPVFTPHDQSSDSLHQSASPPLPPPPSKKCPPPPPPRLTPLLSLTSSSPLSAHDPSQTQPRPASQSAAYPRFVFQHHPPESYQPPVQESQAKSVKCVSFSQQ